MSREELLQLVRTFPWDDWNRRLQDEFDPVYREILTTQGGRAAAAHDAEFNPNDPRVQSFVDEYVGERIVQLDATTREDVSDLLRREFDAAQTEEGATPFELGTRIAEAVQEKFLDYARYRADRIARTETGIAYNHGALFGYAAAGYTQVEVSDGDDDEECAAADGQIWSIEEALANPLEHPNCTRAFDPVEAGEEDEAA